jgi:hypothetical protein
LDKSGKNWGEMRRKSRKRVRKPKYPKQLLKKGKA